MSQLNVELCALDRARIVREIVEALEPRLAQVFRESLAKPLEQSGGIGQGVRVITREEAAKRRGVSARHLIRLQGRRVPRPRRISERRVGFLAHELEDIPAEAVRVRDNRTLNRRELAAKLGVHPLTLRRFAPELPPPLPSGEWLEREVDDWLLERPRA